MNCLIILFLFQWECTMIGFKAILVCKHFLWGLPLVAKRILDIFLFFDSENFKCCNIIRIMMRKIWCIKRRKIQIHLRISCVIFSWRAYVWFRPPGHKLCPLGTFNLGLCPPLEIFYKSWGFKTIFWPLRASTPHLDFPFHPQNSISIGYDPEVLGVLEARYCSNIGFFYQIWSLFEVFGF